MDFKGAASVGEACQTKFLLTDDAIKVSVRSGSIILFCGKGWRVGRAVGIGTFEYVMASGMLRGRVFM